MTTDFFGKEITPGLYRLADCDCLCQVYQDGNKLLIRDELTGLVKLLEPKSIRLIPLDSFTVLKTIKKRAEWIQKYFPEEDYQI